VLTPHPPAAKPLSSSPSTLSQPEKRVDPSIQETLSALWLIAIQVLWSERAAEEFMSAAQHWTADLRLSSDLPSTRVIRAQIFRRALPLLFKKAKTEARQLTPPEQIMLDALKPGKERLFQFEGYFHRLPSQDQALLILRDHQKWDWELLSLCLGEAPDSIKTRRTQALRTLEAWIHALRAESVRKSDQTDCFWLRDCLFAPDPNLPKAAEQHFQNCRTCQKGRTRALAVTDRMTQFFEEVNSAAPALPNLTLRADDEKKTGPRAALKSTSRLAQRSLNTLKEPRTWLSSGAFRSWIAVLGVVFVLLTIPRARSLYERHLDRRLESYFLPSQVQVTPEEVAKAVEAEALRERAGPAQNKEISPTTPSLQGSDDSEFTEEAVEAEEEGAEEIPLPEPSLRGGVWRFHLKTHSPKEIRQLIIQHLKTARVIQPGKGAEGIEAPGGIQFDFLIPRESLGPLRDFLKQTVSGSDKTPAGGARESNQRASLESALFTWYRGKSATPIPTGQAKVIIWLSQI
jgi:hypothetical protein